MLTDVPIVPYIPASDLDRARRFYEDKVGLVPRDANDGGVAYDCAGGSWIYLYKSMGAGTSEASQAFWQVRDIQAEVRQLKSPGCGLHRLRPARYQDHRWSRHDGRRHERGMVPRHRRQHPGAHPGAVNVEGPVPAREPSSLSRRHRCLLPPRRTARRIRRASSGAGACRHPRIRR